MGGSGVLGRCAVCSSLSSGQCSSCFNAFYCGPDHQKKDWKTHKKECKRPYEVKESDIAGR